MKGTARPQTSWDAYVLLRITTYMLEALRPLTSFYEMSRGL